MKGLELSRNYYETYGLPMLEESFGGVLPKIAVGLFGSGSECFGFDDEISKDHDFEPGFCIFLPGEEVVDRQTAFQLERAYAKLPKEYAGFKRQILPPVGGNRHGVIRADEFFNEKAGTPDGILTDRQWLSIPEYALAEVTNGDVFRDDSGFVSDIRKRLSEMPEDVRRKRLAGNLLLMAQSGQYNYGRCISHGETGAAQLALFEFVKSAIEAAFLLNSAYMPYYKWSFRALKSLPKLSDTADSFEFLLSNENTKESAETKSMIVEDLALMFIGELQEQNLTKAICADLEKHAYSVNDSIQNPEIRNLNILAGV